MDLTLKKAIMLLNSLIYHYHGLDAEEEELLKVTSTKYDADEALQWANQFIAEDYISAFERSKKFLKPVFTELSKPEITKYLNEIWEGNYDKGYVTEMELSAMKQLAEDWGISKEFTEIVASSEADNQ